MEVTIGQFARIVGTTVRTLRYYDKIGLLTPERFNENGWKVYTRGDWETFQQSMILKHVGLSLNEIKEQVMNQKLKNRELLLVQKKLIEKKQAELNDKLEVITRMERLYNMEGVVEEELNEFAFIMLDLFRREKSQIQALEEYFSTDEQLMEEIKMMYDSKHKEKMDREIWNLIRSIKNVIQYNDSTSRKKVQEILNNMENLFPTTTKNVLRLADEDDQFLAKYNHEFTMYFPENIASYINKELKTYYDNQESDRDK